jgi:hypothetical protein
MKRYVLTHTKTFGYEVYDTTISSKDMYKRVYGTRNAPGSIGTDADIYFITRNSVLNSDDVEELYERMCVEAL